MIYVCLALSLILNAVLWVKWRTEEGERVAAQNIAAGALDREEALQREIALRAPEGGEHGQ